MSAPEELSMHPALEPFTLKNLHLSSRAVVAPMSRVSATSAGVPTAQMADYYGSFARGGFGLIVGEGANVDARCGRAYERQPGLCSDAQVEGWKHVTSAVHREGAVIVAQLMHAGALSQTLADTRAPSAITPRGTMLRAYRGEGPFPRPRAMSADDIRTAIDAFAASARAAVAAGFDGVEIHGANGYLVDEFFTEELNAREDAYGGSMAARSRFALEVIRAIRASVPNEFVVGLRISQGKVNDLKYRWSRGAAHAYELFGTLRAELPDYLHVASGGLHAWNEDADLGDGASVTGLARGTLGIPVLANGGLHDPSLAAHVLASGHADLLALGRGALANPDWPKRVAAGLPIRSFDPKMLSPLADLDAAAAWAAQTTATGGDGAHVEHRAI